MKKKQWESKISQCKTLLDKANKRNNIMKDWLQKYSSALMMKRIHTHITEMFLKKKSVRK